MGECSLIYSSLKTELSYLNDLQSDKKWIVTRIAEIKELLTKLDTL